MVYRLTAVLITLAWATMTWLFIRVETNPDAAIGLLALPPEHVLNQMFLAEEDSELNIFDREYKLGTLYVHPGRTDEGLNELLWSGDMLLRVPGLPRQRIYIKGSATMTPTFQSEDFAIQIALRDPSLKIEIETSSSQNGYHYRIMEGKTVLREADGSISALLKEDQLQSVGVDPSRFTQAVGNARLTARRASVAMRMEKIDAYQLSLTHSEGLRSDFFITQIGKLVLVRTFFGYTLRANGFEP